MKLPTLRVRTKEGDEIKINACDFNPELYDFSDPLVKETEPESSSSPVVSLGLSEVNANEAKRIIKSLTTFDEVSLAFDEESEGKARVSVLEAIQNRRAELGG